MDKFQLARMREDTPKINEDIANGLAVKEIPKGESYIDQVFYGISKDFPQGLRFDGSERCSPEEELGMSRRRNDRPIFEIAESQIHLKKYKFKWTHPTSGKTEDIVLYIYLPYVRQSEAGAILLSGSRYFFSPVLSDVVLSYEKKGIFVVLLRDKFSIRRVHHDVRIDGRTEGMQVAWSEIYHTKPNEKKKRRSVTAKCSLMHYLLCRHGFTESFARYGNCHPVVGKEDITPERYPPSEWVIVETASLRRPRTFSARGLYWPTGLRVAIRKEEFTPLVKSMIAAFFYVVDHFSSRVEPEHIDNLRLWRQLMGLLLFGDDNSEGTLYEDVTEHIRSLDEYMDTWMVARFQQIDINVDDIYAFFAVAIEKMDSWMMEVPQRINSLYDKELSVLYHTFLNFTSQIFKMHFKLKTASKKNQGLSKDEILNVMNSHLTTRGIFSLTRQPPGVSNMMYSGDNKFFKLTGVMVPQKNNKASGDEGKSYLDESKQFHVSFAVVGNYSNLPKSSPSGDGRVNPHLRLDPNNRVMRNKALDPMLEEIQAVIDQKQVL